MVAYTWTCSCCGRQYNDLPTHWSCGPPASYHMVPAEDVAARVEMNDDVCLIDQMQWFIRGHIEIPIVGLSERLVFNVWASLSDASMQKVMETWDEPNRATQPAYFGWHNTELSPFPRSLNLAAAVQNRAPSVVPLISLAPADHPLYTAQYEGVTMERVVEITELLLPRH